MADHFYVLVDPAIVTAALRDQYAEATTYA